MNIQDYIASGIIESYVMGLASESERTEFEERVNTSVVLKKAVHDFEEHLEEFALSRVSPPKGTRDAILRLISDRFGTPMPEKSVSNSRIITDVKIINAQLCEKIIQRPESMHQLTGRQFEEVTAELLMKLGYNVSLTKASRDGGKDIFIAQNTSIGNFLYFVECKKLTLPNKVGVNVLRELYGTVSAGSATAGIIVTSSYFSKDARDFQEKIKHRLSLIDYLEILKWIDKIKGLLPGTPADR